MFDEKAEETLTTENFNGQKTTEALSGTVLNTRFEDLNPSVVDNTKR